MPTYDYACTSCGSFDALRPMGQRDLPVACPHCGEPSPRVFAFGAHLAQIDETTRRAMDINERAAHVPHSSRNPDGYLRLRHPSGCSCCAGSTKQSKTRVLPNGNKMFAGSRPWMISH